MHAGPEYVKLTGNSSQGHCIVMCLTKDELWEGVCDPLGADCTFVSVDYP